MKNQLNKFSNEYTLLDSIDYFLYYIYIYSTIIISILFFGFFIYSFLFYPFFVVLLSATITYLMLIFAVFLTSKLLSGYSNILLYGIEKKKINPNIIINIDNNNLIIDYPSRIFLNYTRYKNIIPLSNIKHIKYMNEKEKQLFFDRKYLYPIIPYKGYYFLPGEIITQLKELEFTKPETLYNFKYTPFYYPLKKYLFFKIYINISDEDIIKYFSGKHGLK